MKRCGTSRVLERGDDEAAFVASNRISF